MYANGGYLLGPLDGVLCLAYMPYFHRRGDYSDTEIEYFFAFVSSGVLAVLKRWLMTGCREPEEKIAQLIPECDENISISAELIMENHK
ncbi:MAG: TetR family transcriptional regulator C-terminal domain-containing protein [Lachnospiraceae bacterium]|nr:TetR family transcriptional regulator C-terminal domain-containing protein [Lachnospiraceae bacterium]